MAQQDIVRFIKIDTSNSDRSINSLKSEIKSLNTELGKLTVGSQRYNEVSRQLTTRQQELREVTRDLQLASRTTEQRFNNLQRFSTGLTAGFTTLANTFALLGSDSEDFNKTITKLTGSLAILQSVGGLKDLVSSFPGVISGFKNIGDSIKRFFTGAINSFDPLERRLSEAAGNLKNIGKIDIQADIKTEGGQAANISNTNKQLADQQKTIIPLNEQWDKYNKELQEALSYTGDYTSDLEKLKKIFLEYNKTAVSEATVNIKQLDKATKEFYKGNLEPMRQFFNNLVLDQDALTVTANSMGVSYDQLAKGLENFGQNVEQDSEYLKNLRQQLLEVEKAGGKAVSGISKLGGILKSILATVGWTLVITAIVGAIYKLVDYIKTIKSAAKEQREFNQAINKTTSELSSSKLAKFYELQKAFEAIGNSAEGKKKFLEDYADQLDETGLAITDVQTAEDAFINNTDKYVQAIIARAKIDAYREQITKKTQETIEKNLELERQLESGEYKNLKPGQRVAVGSIGQSGGMYGPSTPTDRDIKQRQEAIEEFQEANKKAIEDEIEANNKALNDIVTSMVGGISDLTKEFSGLWASTTDGAKTTGNVIKQEIINITDLINDILDKDDFLDRFEEYQKLIQDVTFGPGETEFTELQEWYNNAIDLYKQYGGDLEQLEEEYNKRYTELKDKIYKKQVEDAKKAREQELQSQITAVKELYDYQTKQLSLYKPKTTYKQLGLTFQYQSGDDVKKEYDNTVDYNNQILAFTQERINKEKELYNAALENEATTADERLEINKKLAENKKTLSDAVAQNEQANTQATIDMQRKKLQAFQSSVQVASSVLSSLSTVFDAKAQTAKTEKEQKKAAKTAKNIKAAQAVIDALSAANGAYSAMASIPYVGPALGAAAAAAALIAGYANVKQIYATDTNGSSTVSTGSVSAPAVNTPAVTYTRNVLGDQETDEVNKPQVCLVVEDLNQVQNRMQVRESNATF